MNSPDLKRLRRVWGTLGKHDPLWAILSVPETRGGRWDVEAFFASGAAEVQALEIYFSLFNRPLRRYKALDFGCGVGRVSRALAPSFVQAIGVDIAASMIAKANELNADITNLRFVENPHPNLHTIDSDSIDLVYSNITLQHIPPKLASHYIREFLRVLAPGGLAVFQLACGYEATWRGCMFRWVPNGLLNPLRRLLYMSSAVFEMYVVPESTVVEAIRAGSGILLHAENYTSAGAGFVSRRFFVTKETL